MREREIGREMGRRKEKDLYNDTYIQRTISIYSNALSASKYGYQFNKSSCCA